MGVLASSQRVPLPPFHSFQQWRIGDVQTLLARFEKEQNSFGFKITEEEFEALIKDLPAVPPAAAGGGGAAVHSPLPPPPAAAPLISPAPAAQQGADTAARRHGRGASISLPAGSSIALPPIPAAAAATVNGAATGAAVVPPLVLPISGGSGVKRAKHSPTHSDLMALAEEKEAVRSADHSLPTSTPTRPVQHGAHHAHVAPTGHYATPISVHEHHHHNHAHVHIQPHAPSVPHAHVPVRRQPAESHGPFSVTFNAPEQFRSGSHNSKSGVTYTPAALFTHWMGAERQAEGASQLDLLELVSGLVVLCRARFREKLQFLFALFDFDEDGILNRREMQVLVRSVAVVLHRIHGVGVASPSQTRPGTSSANSGNSGSANLREPTVRQCERWNEQLVRRFESTLRAGAWNLNGWTEWAESSPLAVHLLCSGCRTPGGLMATTDAARVLARLHDAHRMLTGAAAAGSGSASARGSSRSGGSAAAEIAGADMLLRLNGGALTDRSANLYMSNPRSARGSSTLREYVPASVPVSPKRSRAPSRNRARTADVAAHATAASTPSAASSAFPPGTGSAGLAVPGAVAGGGAGSAPLGKSGSGASLSGAGSGSNSSTSSSRFKFLGEKNTHREVMHLKKLFDDMDIDSSGLLSVDYLRRPKKYTEAFLIRDVTAVFQEWKGFGNGAGAGAAGGGAGAGGAQGNGQNRGGGGGGSDSSSHRAEVSFSELLDVLYTDLTPAQHALLHSWVPAPVNKEKVRAIQRVFDRLDTEFTGRVKFAKVMAYAFRNGNAAGGGGSGGGGGDGAVPPPGLGGSAASTAELQALMEPFVRLRPHRLEIAVTIRELLTALFNRTHSKQLRKILSWSKPSKLLTLEQQAELQRLFQQYDTANEGRFPAAHLRDHLVARGLPEAEVDKMMEDIVVEYTAPAIATGAESSAQSQQPQAMISLQEFQLFYRSFWDSYVNFQLEEEACKRKKVLPSTRLVGVESNPATL